MIITSQSCFPLPYKQNPTHKSGTKENALKMIKLIKTPLQSLFKFL